MKLTRIDFRGTGKMKDYFATAQYMECHASDNQIHVTLYTMDPKEEREHWVNAACVDGIYSMADCLQCFLDGYKGSNSEIQMYYYKLLELSDI